MLFRSLEFTDKISERKRVRNPNHAQVHHKAGVIGGGKADGAAPYFKEVAAGVADAHEILVLGPASAKLEFLSYLHKHAPAVEAKVIGVETADHPTDAQILAYARTRFHAADRMMPQIH